MLIAPPRRSVNLDRHLISLLDVVRYIEAACVKCYVAIICPKARTVFHIEAWNQDLISL